ncbi:hypothetical protein PYCC9005_003368 [Savitreella phatthalungensis]
MLWIARPALSSLQTQYPLLARRWITTSSDEDDLIRSFIGRYVQSSASDDDECTIPRSLMEITFSRSSGPGGQHVNTTSSRASVRVRRERLVGCGVPVRVVDDGLRSRFGHLVTGDGDLLVHAQTSRSSHANREIAVARIRSVVLEAAKGLVDGVTADETRERVRKLAKQDNERRLQGKKHRSAKKRERRGRMDDS